MVLRNTKCSGANGNRIPVLRAFLLVFCLTTLTNHVVVAAGGTDPITPLVSPVGVEQTFVVNGLFGDPTAIYDAKLANGKPLPAWIQLDPGNGTFTYRAPNNERGNYYQIRVTATAGKKGGTADFYLAITDAGSGCEVDANTDRLAQVPDCKNGQTYLRGLTSTGSYRWTGPDNFTSSSQEPRVKKPGLYVLSGGGGCTAIDVVQVLDKDYGCSGSVESNKIPDAKISTPEGTVVGTTVALDGSSSNDADGSIIDYFWSWEGGAAVGSRPTVSLPVGTHKIVLTVTDNTGARSTDRITVKTTNDAPTASEETTPVPNLDGYWLEAECAAVGGNWSVKSGGGASSGAYVTASRSSTKNVPSDSDANRIRFNVTVAKAGDYYLFARIAASDNLHDSYYVRINNGKWYEWNTGIKRGANFQWNDLPDQLRLAKGNNTIDFAYRERETHLDKLYLSPKNTPPSGEGAVATNCDDLATGEEMIPVPPTTTLPTGSEFWLEAECAAVGSKWTTADASDASGGSFVVYTRGSSTDAAPSDQQPNMVSFTVDAEAGKYTLFARVEAPSNQDDSYWVRINGGDWYEWNSGMQQGKGFNWNELPQSLKFDNGINTIDFAYRESNTRLDKIYLTKKQQKPRGTGGAASNCGNAATTVSSNDKGVWIEAECASVGSGWEYGSSSAASQGKYVVFPGESSLSGASSKFAEAINIEVDLATSGTYRLFMHLDAADPGSNSFWVKMDNGNWIRFYRELGDNSLLTKGFEWRQVNHDGQAVTFDLTAGTHRITVANREAGTKLDKLYLTTESSAPSGKGGEASNCNGSTSTAAPMSMATSGNATTTDTRAARTPVAATPYTGDTEAAVLSSEPTVELYPNPTVDQLNVRLSSDYEGRVLMMLTNGQGRQVRQLSYDKADAVFSERIQVDQLPAGMYYLRILEGDRQTVKPFVKGR